MTKTKIIEEVQLPSAKDMRKIREAQWKKKKRKKGRRIFVFSGKKR